MHNKYFIIEFCLTECFCNPEGSESLQCNEDGFCMCKPNIGNILSSNGTMEKCDHCLPDFYGFPNCQGKKCFKNSAYLLIREICHYRMQMQY